MIILFALLRPKDWIAEQSCVNAKLVTNQYNINEKALTETQTLHTGCSKAAKKISPDANTLPGGAVQSKFNQLEMVTIFTYKPSLVRINARNFKLLW